MRKSDIKKIEDMLYTVFLDLSFSKEYMESHLHDLNIEMKESKKTLTKINRNLKKATEKFTELKGYPPKRS